MSHIAPHLRRIVAVGSLALIAVAGCKSEPKRHRAPEDFGPADTNSSVGMPEPVPMVYLDDLVVKASQGLAEDLPNLAAVKAAPSKCYFAVPTTLQNDFGFPDGRLRETLTRLQAELSQARSFTDAFVVISQTELDAKQDIKNVAGKDLSGFRDPLQQTPDDTKPRVYPPNLVYTMTGKFYQSNERGQGKRSYHLFIQVNRPQTRSSIWNKDFVYNIRWNTHTGKWELDA